MSHVHVQAIYTFTLLIPLIPRQYAEPTKKIEGSSVLKKTE